MKKFSPGLEFKEFYKVTKSETGRRLVMTDIHGYCDTFVELLGKVGLNKDDQLFLLGDFVDRGKKSKETLDKIIELIGKGYLVFPLRGNHEDECHKSHLKKYSDEDLKIPRYKWGRYIVDEKLNILPEYEGFIGNLPYYYELDDFYLVHAGFNFKAQNPFTDYRSMLWGCNTEEDIVHLGKKTIVHGHSKRTLSHIKETVRTKKQIIGLDNSVYTTNHTEFGNLVCLDLDSWELVVQESVG